MPFNMAKNHLERFSDKSWHCLRWSLVMPPRRRIGVGVHRTVHTGHTQGGGGTSDIGGPIPHRGVPVHQFLRQFVEDGVDRVNDDPFDQPSGCESDMPRERRAHTDQGQGEVSAEVDHQVAVFEGQAHPRRDPGMHNAKQPHPRRDPDDRPASEESSTGRLRIEAGFRQCWRPPRNRPLQPGRRSPPVRRALPWPDGHSLGRRCSAVRSRKS